MRHSAISRPGPPEATRARDRAVGRPLALGAGKGMIAMVALPGP